MENFGLGILLNFQDNASSGIDRVMSALESLRSHIEEMNQSAVGSTAHLSAMASSLGVIGTLATGVGVAVTGAFGSILHSVATTGAEFERTKIAMGQLYGSAEEGRKRMIANMKMAATTPFDMDKFNTLATQMKSINIEADKQLSVVDKFGKKHTQTIAEYVGDLAAMRPDKRFEDASREIIEFLEGNARPLKMSFGLDIPKLLGEEMGATAEDRLDQYIRAIAQRAYVGTMQGLNGSWDNIFSNLGDHVKWFVFYVTESGIFEQIKKPFSDLNEYLTELMSDESAMKQLGQAVSDALGMIVAPAISVLNVIMRLSVAFVEFAKEHPKIVSMGVAFVGLGGQILAVGGAITLFTALWLKFRASVLGGMTLIGYLRNGLILLRSQVLALARSVLPLTVTLGLLYLAWEKNFLGIRTFVSGGLQYVSNFLSVLVDALTHIDTATKTFSLSDENWELAEQMGIVDVIHWFVLGGYYALKFGEAVAKGFETAMKVIEQIGKDIEDFFKSFENTPIEGLGKDVKELSDIWINAGLEEKIVAVGEAVGKLAVFILSAAAGIRMFQVFRSAAGWIGTFGKAIFEVANFLTGGWLRGIVLSIRQLGLLKTAFDVFKILRGLLFGSPWGIAIMAIGLAIGFVAEHWETFKNVAMDVWNKLQPIFKRIEERLVPVFERVKKAFEDLWKKLDEVIPKLGAPFAALWGALNGNEEDINTVLNEIGFAFEVLVTVIGGALELAITTIAGFVERNVILFTGLIEFLEAVFEGRWGDAFNSLKNTGEKFMKSWEDTANSYKKTVTGIWDDLTKLFENPPKPSAPPAIPVPDMPNQSKQNSPWFDFTMPDLSGLKSSVNEFTSSLESGIDEVVGSVEEKLTPVVEYVETAFEIMFQSLRLAFYNFVADVVNPFVDMVEQKVSELGQFISDFLNAVVENISQVMSAISSVVMPYIQSAAEFILQALNSIGQFAADVVNSIVELLVQFSDFVVDTFSNLANYGMEIFSALMAFILSAFVAPLIAAFDSVLSSAVSVFNAVKGVIIEAFNTAGAVVGEIIDGIKSKISGIMDSVGSLLDKLPSLSGMKETLSGITAEADAAQERAQRVIPDHKAKGGIVQNKILTWFAEDSPEAAIPINNSQRSKDLWLETGRMLGMFADSPTVEGMTQTVNNAINLGMNVSPQIPPMEIEQGDIFSPISVALGNFVERLEVLPNRIFEAMDNVVSSVSVGGRFSPQVAVESVSPVRSSYGGVQSQGANTTDSSIHFHIENGAIQITAQGSTMDADKLAREIVPRIKRLAEIEFMQKRGR